jgi:hypothetical protein
MASEFEGDLRDALSGLAEARQKFEALVGALNDADLRRARRGGWDIGTVIKHVVDSEWHYAGKVEQLRGSPAANAKIDAGDAFETVEQACKALAASRKALLASVDGVGEEEFYQLGGSGQEYSVLSVLQNVRQHDIEHGEQAVYLRDTAPAPG